MKTFFVFLFALAGFAMPATAQVYSPNWGSALNRAMAGPNAANAMWRAQQDYAGRQYYGGYYDSYGQPYGYYRGNSSVRTAVAVAVGYAAGAGTVMALSAVSHRGGRPLAGPSNVRNGNNGGEFVLSNQTRYAVEVYFGKGKYQGRLASGESWNVKGPKPNEKYSGFVLIPSHNGGLSSDEVPIQPTQSGWTFVEPDFVRQQGGR